MPSLRRGVEDYTEDAASLLTSRPVAAGYRVILVQPRGHALNSEQPDLIADIVLVLLAQR